jgi:hypothetical protein
MDLSVLDTVLAGQYLTGAGLVLLLWDHLITLDEEVAVIWNSKRKGGLVYKLAFVFNRYGSEGILLFVVYITCGLQSNITTELCQGFIIFVGMIGTFAVTISQFIFLLRVYALWDQRKGIAYSLIIGFVIALSVSQACAVMTVLEIKKTIAYVSAPLKTCGVTVKPLWVIGLWAALCVYDLFIVVLTVFNAMDRPHRNYSELSEALHRDGARYFLGLFALRLVNLIMSIVGGPQHALLLMYLFWAIFSMMMSRLHFRMEELYWEEHSPQEITESEYELYWRRSISLR